MIRDCGNCGNFNCIDNLIGLLYGDECIINDFKNWKPILTERHVDEAKHCIGMDHRKPYKRHGKMFYRPYRNYFATIVNNEIWTAVEFYGYASHGSITERDGIKICIYYLTRKGLDWLAEQLDMTIYDEEE